jgi:ribosome-associated protein
MTASDNARRLAAVAALAADDKLATDVVVLDVSEQLVLTEAFVIASASSERQVNGIVDEIEDKLREIDVKPTRREGTREGRWALLDYLDIVVHVFHQDERDYYALEKLWKDCPHIEVEGLGERERADETGDAPEEQ